MLFQRVKLRPIARHHWKKISVHSDNGLPPVKCTKDLFLGKKRLRPQKDLSERWHPTPVLLPGKSHGRRSLVGFSPWGREESDTTERLHFHFSLSCTGEGNGNPLQCSCLENPRDRGAWWAAVYGVAQSWTWLKWFSSLAAREIWMGLHWSRRRL